MRHYCKSSYLVIGKIIRSMAPSTMTLPATEQPLENTDLRWVVYILCCHDGSLYTGITTDLERRLHEHNHSPKGARYTRQRRPVALAYSEKYASRREACRREYEIKQLDRREKQSLISQATVQRHPA